ncbi:unnamed protein product, partial [marine sediment metagenome]
FVASRMKYQKKTQFDMMIDIPLAWKSHAREFIRHTQKLNNPILISYNEWSQDIEYRKKLANTLGVNFTDAGFKEIPAYGGGSSFTGLTEQNLQQSVCNRLLSYFGQPEFHRQIDDEMKELNYEIFRLKLPIIFI